MIIALDLEQTLSAAGFWTIGPARSIEAALPMIEQRNFDVALIDLELQGALRPSCSGCGIFRSRSHSSPGSTATTYRNSSAPRWSSRNPGIPPIWLQRSM